MRRQPIGRSITLGLILALTPGAYPVAPVASGGVPEATGGVTLQDCYKKAHELNETIGISAENVKLVREQYRAQVGAILPHIDWIGSRFYQEKVNKGDTSSAGNSQLKDTQQLSYFQLEQPIFAGLRDWAAMDILKSQSEQARLNQKQTDLDLLADVANTFYLALTLQDQLVVLQQVRKLNQDQVNQLSHWVDIGRSRPAELLSAQTQAATLDADIENVTGLLAQARHLLLFLTGVPADVPLIDSPTSLPPTLTLDEALNRAGTRPDLLSGVENLTQSELLLRYARGGHLPTLGLLGRYYTERTGFLSDVRWDATFTLDVPIYAGGSTQAEVRQGKSQQIIAQLQLGRAKRVADREVRTAYEDLGHARREAAAYEKAQVLTQKNFEAQQKEYRTGAISNLELLRLLTDMQDVRRQTLISRSTAKLDEVRLQITMGEGL